MSLFEQLFKHEGESDIYNISPVISLNSFENCIDDLIFKEDYNSNKLAFLLLNIDKVERLYRDDARNEVCLVKFFEKDFNISNDKILEKKDDKIYKVIYNQSTGDLCGRLQAKNALSGQAMVREARNFIFNDNYRDVDISNAHPVFTEWLCKNLMIKCDALSDYINNREETIWKIINYFKEMQKTSKVEDGTFLEEDAIDSDFIVLETKDEKKKRIEVNRSFVKTYLLKIAYGCGNKAINEIPSLYRHPLVNEYVECMRNIAREISKRFKPFHELNVKRRIENNKNYNLEGSTLSHLNQYIENQVLLMMIDILSKESINTDCLKNMVLCFDGLMIHKNTFNNVDFNMDSFINKCQVFFHSAGLSKFKLEVKEMEYHDIVLNKLSESGSIYESSKDYKSLYAKNKIKQSLRDLKYYRSVCKDLGFYSKFNYEHKKILIKAFELNIKDVKDYKYLKYDDFINFLYSKTWNSYMELASFIKAFAHLFIVRATSSKNGNFILNKLTKYIQYEEATLDCGLVYYYEYSDKEDKDGAIVGKEIKKVNMRFDMLIALNLINNIKRYDDIIFKPFDENKKRITFYSKYDINDFKSFNIFSGFWTKLISKDKVEEVRNELNIIYSHITNVLANGNEEHGKYILLWLNHIFTKPFIKTRKILTFVSKEQQVGKGIFADGFLSQKIFGKYLSGMENGLDFAKANFNSQLKTRLLTVVEEVRPSSDARKGVFDSLKTLSADDSVLINEKHIKQRQFESFNNFILHSNHFDSLQIEDKDKRFVVFRCGEQHLNDKDYFNILSNAMDKDGVADAFFTDVYNMDFSSMNIKDSPRTELYNEIHDNCLSGPVRFYTETKEYLNINEYDEMIDNSAENNEDEDLYSTDDYMPWIKFFIQNKKVSKKYGYIILKSKLFECYKLWAGDSNEKYSSKENKFYSELKGILTEHRFNFGTAYVL